MATKPFVQPSYVEDIETWKEIVNIALTPPTEEQLKEMEQLCKEFDKVYVDDRCPKK